MEDSILKTVKKSVGIADTDTSFDPDILVYASSAMSNLNQLGIGPDGGIVVEDETTGWSSLGIPQNQLNMAKTLVCLRVRLAFDPPAFSFHLDAIKEQIAEQEGRLSLYRETLLAPEVPLGEVGEEVEALWG
jgi:hypothetical protein